MMTMEGFGNYPYCRVREDIGLHPVVDPNGVVQCLAVVVINDGTEEKHTFPVQDITQLNGVLPLIDEHRV